MKVEHHVLKEFPKIEPYTAIKEIKDTLVTKKFVVVCKNDNDFYGILTIEDIITHPHKLAIDCISEFPRIDANEDIKSVIDIMMINKHFVLPVFKEDIFIGVISTDTIFNLVQQYTNRLSNAFLENRYRINTIRKEAQVAEKLKDVFLRNINHEIRTPLAAIIGFSSLIVSDDKTESEKEDYKNIIEESSCRLLKVMDNIINLSRIQAGDELHGINTETSTDEILRELYLFYKEEMHRMNKDHLHFNYHSKLNTSQPIKYDFQKIKQILDYMLNNAFKYTEKGSVEFGCEQITDKVLQFHVKDTGIGIPKEIVKRIFIPFNKIALDQEDFSQGLGLGLAIANKLALSINGTLTVESEPGKGSCFFLNIPVLA